MEMKASANNAKASDPVEDFISTESKVADADRTKIWAMNEKTKVDMYEYYYVAPGGCASLLFGRH